MSHHFKVVQGSEFEDSGEDLRWSLEVKTWGEVLRRRLEVKCKILKDKPWVNDEFYIIRWNYKRLGYLVSTYVPAKTVQAFVMWWHKLEASTVSNFDADCDSPTRRL